MHFLLNTFLEKALEVVNNIHDLPQKAIIYSHLGSLHLVQKSYKKSKIYFDLSLVLAKKMKRNAGGIFWNTVGLGLLFHHNGDKKNALAYFKKAKQEMKNLGMSKNVFYTSGFLPRS